MDWRMVLVLVIIVVVNLWRDQAYEDQPQRRPVPGVADTSPGDMGPRTPLPAITGREPEVRVGLGDKQDSTGTAFAVSTGGWWMTARHVADQCKEVQLRFPHHGPVRVQETVHHPGADLALLRTAGLPAAMSTADSRLHSGQPGFHIGYPAGRSGEVWSTLLGRRRLRVSGRYRTVEPVVAWAEHWRRPASLRSLGGLSGGPALDHTGRVVGVLVAESRRRGRVYTTAPASMRRMTAQLRPGKSTLSQFAVSPENLHQVGDELRAAPVIAKVICLTRGGYRRGGFR